MFILLLVQVNFCADFLNHLKQFLLQLLPVHPTVEIKNGYKIRLIFLAKYFIV